eukprot:scaffold98_cov248-Ochromonas_danica.AAC.8
MEWFGKEKEKAALGEVIVRVLFMNFIRRRPIQSNSLTTTATTITPAIATAVNNTTTITNHADEVNRSHSNNSNGNSNIEHFMTTETPPRHNEENDNEQNTINTNPHDDKDNDNDNDSHSNPDSSINNSNVDLDKGYWDSVSGYLPDKILLTVPTILTFAQLRDRIHGLYELHHECSFILNGIIYPCNEVRVPSTCFESFHPIGEDKDLFRSRLTISIDLTRPIIEDHLEEDEQKIEIPINSQPDSIIDQDEEELERERNKASRFRDISFLFNIKEEMEAIGCSAYICQLKEKGFFQEGSLAELQEDVLIENGIFIPITQRRPFLQLCRRIQEGLARKDEAAYKRVAIHTGEHDHRRLSAVTSNNNNIDDQSHDEAVDEKKGEDVIGISLTSNLSSKSKKRVIQPSLKQKINAIQRRIHQELELDEVAITVKSCLHPDSSIAEPLLPPPSTFCCNTHRLRVTSHRDRLKAHNVHCFRSELVAKLSWLRDVADSLAGLEQMVEIALNVVHRIGWKATTIADLMLAMEQRCRITQEEMRAIERSLANTSGRKQDPNLCASSFGGVMDVLQYVETLRISGLRSAEWVMSRDYVSAYSLADDNVCLYRINATSYHMIAPLAPVQENSNLDSTILSHLPISGADNTLQNVSSRPSCYLLHNQ